MITEITVQELKKLQDEKADFTLVDVRDPFEYDICNLGGKLIPLSELPERLDELDPNQLIVTHCKMGGRSSKAAAFLQQHGFHKVVNLKGGILAWANEIDSKLMKY